MRARGLLLLSIAFSAIFVGLVAPGVAGASGSKVVASYVIHGKGGNRGSGVVGSVEGTLLADGSATGSGEITTMTSSGLFTFQVQAVGWVAVSPSTDGILTVTSFGQPDCVLLPVGVAKPAPAHHTFTADCSAPAVYIGTYGKVTPTS
jgi:hypothetical protein